MARVVASVPDRADADAARLSPSGGRVRTRPALPFVSPGTRFEELETKATKRPSPLIAGRRLPRIAADRRGTHADALVLTGQQVAHEHVPVGVVVARHHVRRVGFEGHEAALRADRRDEARAVGRHSETAEAHQTCRVRLTVVHEDVADAVGVAADQIRRVRCEGLTKRASALSEGLSAAPSAWAPPAPTLTRSVISSPPWAVAPPESAAATLAPRRTPIAATRDVRARILPLTMRVYAAWPSARRISSSAARPTSSCSSVGSRVPTSRWISKPGFLSMRESAEPSWRSA